MNKDYRRKKAIISIIMILTYFVMVVIPRQLVWADSGVATINTGDMSVTVTGISIVNGDKEEVGDSIETPIPLEEGIRIYYYLQLGNCHLMPDGASMILKLPDQVIVPNNTTIDILGDEVDDNDQLTGEQFIIANCDVYTDKTIVVRFNEAIRDYPEINNVFLYVEGQLDKTQIEGGEQEIKFYINDEVITKYVYVEEKEPEPVEPQPSNVVIEKYGNLDRANRIITWTVKVANKGEQPIGGKTLVDTWETEELAYIEGSFYCNYRSVANQPVVTVSDPLTTLTYEVPLEPEEDYYVWTYQTLVKDTFLESANNRTNYPLTNTAVLIDPELVAEGKDSEISNKVTATVYFDVAWISKRGEGAIAETDNIIVWTISLNDHYGDLNGWTVVDTIDTRLTLKTVELNGVVVDPSTYTYDTTTGRFSYFLSGLENKPYTLKLYTQVNSLDGSNDGGYDDTTYKNAASLVKEPWEHDSNEVEVKLNDDDMIRKDAKGVVLEKQEANWEITVNGNELTLTNVKVKEELPVGLIIDLDNTSSVVAKEGDNVIATKVTCVSEGTETKGPIYEILLNDGNTITGKCTIDLTTKMVDSRLFAVSQWISLTNKATLIATRNDKELPEKSVTANNNYYSEVLTKGSTLYNYQDRSIDYAIRINKNKVMLSDVKLEDVMTPGMGLVEGSVEITLGGEDITSQADRYTLKVHENKCGFTIEFKEPISEECMIYYKGQVINEQLFGKGETVKIENKATLTAKELPWEVTSSAWNDIYNKGITKSGKEQTGEGAIIWTMQVNQNQMNLTEARIEDTLAAGLELDPESITLEKLIVEEDGRCVSANPKEFVEVTYTLDPVTNKVIFYLPTPTTACYELVFTTDVLVAGTYTNKANFYAEGYEKVITGESSKIDIKIVTGGGGGVGNKRPGTITVQKVDQDTNKGLEGAIFTLKNESGKVLKQAVSAADGMVTFANLKLGKYSIEETTPPENYLPGEIKEQVVNITLENRSIHLVFENKENKEGKVSVLKKEAGTENVMAGVVFVLKDSTGKVVAEQITNEDGKASFYGLKVGTYTVEEKEVPANYVATERVSETVIVTADQKDLLYVFYNTPIQDGNITVIKKDGINGRVLAGATIVLKGETGEVLATEVTDEEGKVVFKELKRGTYKVIEMNPPTSYQMNALNNVTVKLTADHTTEECIFFNTPSKGEPEKPIPPTPLDPPAPVNPPRPTTPVDKGPMDPDVILDIFDPNVPGSDTDIPQEVPPTIPDMELPDDWLPGSGIDVDPIPQTGGINFCMDAVVLAGIYLFWKLGYEKGR